MKERTNEAMVQDAAPEGFISVQDRLPTWTDGRTTDRKVYVEARREYGAIREVGFYLASPNGAWDDSDYAPGMRVTHWKPKRGIKE
ncbi:hypothetical protein F6X40_11430 [Paraburkholderia sp. UCT31]|uniref:hypothetical protein n=1 Tax=Paraburkholderia sp. UCT31 TaxID=2615209 RepID=UPI001654D416|nr:hypothetical protein [Paraburkholderia sp. UCT31]MBC8737416.1 hypothetical protein [Paraburkholderia sp. UCT31]